MKRIAKCALGLLSLTIGVSILIWCAYGFFVPSEYFRFQLIDTPQLFMPVVMIWVGWNWLRGDAGKAQQYSWELTIILKMNGQDFGTETERHAILDMKHRLEERLSSEELGEIDGEEFGGGECSIFVHTNTPVKTAKLIREFFASEAPGLKYSLTKSEL